MTSGNIARCPKCNSPNIKEIHWESEKGYTKKECNQCHTTWWA